MVDSSVTVTPIFDQLVAEFGQRKPSASAQETTSGAEAPGPAGDETSEEVR